VFAELADVTFMDAWLPEYSKDSMGTNLVLVRSSEILALIQEGMEKNEIYLSTISIEKVIKSQAGVLDLKRNQLSYRLYIALQEGQKAPKKRVPSEERIGALKKREFKLKAKMQKESRKLFLDCYQNRTLDINVLRDGMQPYLKQKKRIDLIRKLALPIQIVKK
jgi:coenzyme F420-reducing hydrogenase beta subunit